MKLLKFFLPFIVLGLALACGGSSRVAVDTGATEAAAEAVAAETAEAEAAETAEAAPDTPTPAPTPTPEPNPTPTPAPADAPAEADAAASSEEDTIDLVAQAPDVSLTLEDLPPGFELVPPAEMGYDPSRMGSEEVPVAGVFTFVQPDTVEILMGFVNLLPDRLDQVGYDIGLSRPELFSRFLVSNLGQDVRIVNQEVVPVDDIGDKSTGLTVLADVAGIPMRVDVIIFRKGDHGVFTSLTHIDGEEPTASLEDLARTLAERIETE